MNKIFCKRNLIVCGVMLGVLLCLIFALVFGKTEPTESNKKANVFIYCLVAIILSIVMFGAIIKTIDKKTKIYFIILFCLFVFGLVLKSLTKCRLLMITMIILGIFCIFRFFLSLVCGL